MQIKVLSDFILPQSRWLSFFFFLKKMMAYMWVKRIIYLSLVWMQTGTTTGEICVMLFLKVRNIFTTFPVIPLLGIYTVNSICYYRDMGTIMIQSLAPSSFSQESLLHLNLISGIQKPCVWWAWIQFFICFLSFIYLLSILRIFWYLLLNVERLPSGLLLFFLCGLINQTA